MKNSENQSKPSVNLENLRFLNATQLGKYLGKSTDYVTRLAKKRIIPFMQPPGGSRIFEKEKVIAALARFEMKEVGRDL